MIVNEGRWDRAVRILAGIALVYVAGGAWPATGSVMSGAGAVSMLAGAIGAIALITGIVGWCPVYAVCHVSTKTRVGA